MALSQLEKKKRDALEMEVHAAYIQAKNIREQFHMFDNNLKRVLEKYEAWLGRRGEQSKINLEFYKAFK
jgi:hypothetical protein